MWRRKRSGCSVSEIKPVLLEPDDYSPLKIYERSQRINTLSLVAAPIYAALLMDPTSIQPLKTAIDNAEYLIEACAERVGKDA